MSAGRPQRDPTFTAFRCATRYATAGPSYGEALLQYLQIPRPCRTLPSVGETTRPQMWRAFHGRALPGYVSSGVSPFSTIAVRA